MLLVMLLVILLVILLVMLLVILLVILLVTLLVTLLVMLLVILLVMLLITLLAMPFPTPFPMPLATLLTLFMTPLASPFGTLPPPFTAAGAGLLMVVSAPMFIAETGEMLGIIDETTEPTAETDPTVEMLFPVPVVPGVTITFGLPPPGLPLAPKALPFPLPPAFE